MVLLQVTRASAALLEDRCGFCEKVDCICNRTHNEVSLTAGSRRSAHEVGTDSCYVSCFIEPVHSHGRRPWRNLFCGKANCLR